MIVHIPSPLQSYTKQKLVDGSGNTVAELLNNLNEKYPGIRFRMIDEQDRIRQHIRVFVNKKPVSKLDLPVHPSDEVHIICALSGG